MDKFKLDTSIQFPFFKLNEVVTYSEVKKPSGVAYILLVLINESKTKTDRLANVLENFGVPKSLHYIFADTLQYLFDQDILEGNFNYYKNSFDSYRIGDFIFTERGKKIFAEESIPTGVNKDTKVPLFYDIAKNELSLKLNDDLDAKPLMDCAITPEFMSQFKCKKDIENFLNLSKGKGIGIKKEEIITKVEQLDKIENLVGKYDCIMNIEGNKLDIKFDDLVLQKFFDTYYNSNIINKTISYKNKFKFKSVYSDNLKLNDYSNLIDGILLPKEIEDVLKQKCQMVISKGNYSCSNGYVINNVKCIENFDNTVEFVQIDMHNLIYAYVPGIFNFENDKFGCIKLPLVLKLKLSSNDLRKIVSPYIAELKNYNENNFETLVKVTNITKDADAAFLIMDNYLGENFENNIVTLNEMKKYALSNVAILNHYKNLLQFNYDNYIKTITEDNLESFLKITSSIPKFLNIQNKDILNKIFENLEIKNTIKVYETLVDRGFDKAIVSLYVNPIPDLLKGKIAENKALIDFINYIRAIESLKKITGILDYKNYIVDDENINHQDFKNLFNTIFTLQKEIEIFRKLNEQLFIEFAGFVKVFSAINDDINMVDSALKNPNNIKRELIDKKISSGDYQFVFVNLSAKLEILLKNKYGLDGKLSDMLSNARKEGLIEKSIVNDLHVFRENRNAYIHPEDRITNFKIEDLRKWCNEIFDLEEDKK